MANNVEVTAGSGTTFKTTDNAGVHTGHVNVDACALPTGAATAAKQDTAATAIADVETAVAAVQTAVEAVTAKIIAAPATEAKQDTLNTTATAIKTSVDAVTAKLIAAPATEAKQDTIATAVGDVETAVAAVESATTLVETAVNTLTTLVGGDDAAHDAADGTTKPVKIGSKAVAGVSGVTLVAANDRTNNYAGLDGVPYVRPHCGLEDIVSGVASNTDGASTEVIAAAGAGVKQYLTSATIINTSASMVYVELKSGTTVKWRLPVPATSGAIFNPPVPLPPNAANEAWNFDSSAAATTLYFNAIGFKSKV